MVVDSQARRWQNVGRGPAKVTPGKPSHWAERHRSARAYLQRQTSTGSVVPGMHYDIMVGPSWAQDTLVSHRARQPVSDEAAPRRRPGIQATEPPLNPERFIVGIVGAQLGNGKWRRASLPHVSRRSVRLLAPLQGLMVDG